MSNLTDILLGQIGVGSKLAILGAGSYLKADDAAGVLITQQLSDCYSEAEFPNLRIYIGESAPENYTGEIKKFKPDHLIIIDAADLNEEPGSITLIDRNVISGVSFSTHMLPLKIMLDYLVDETGCSTTIVGIQPEDITYGGEVSSRVTEAVDDVVAAFKDVINRISE